MNNNNVPFFFINSFNRIYLYFFFDFNNLNLFSIKKKKIIKIKNKKWNIENFCFGPFKISNLIIKIVENQIINIHNTCFFRVYKIISRDEKDYKELISKIGFRLFSGVSFRFIKNILTFCKKKENITINKVFYIAFLVYIKNFLIRILQTINSDFEYISIIDNKIITENYKIYVNGKSSLILIEQFKQNTNHNLYYSGCYQNIKYGNKKRLHILLKDGENNRIGATSSKKIFSHSNGYLNTFLLGKQSNGSDQYGLWIIKGEGYESSFIEYKTIPYDLVEDFCLEDIRIYYAKLISYSFAWKNLEINKALLRGYSQEIINIKKNRILNNSEDLLKEKLEVNHIKLGEEFLNSLNSLERMNLELKHEKFLDDSKKFI